MIDKNITYFGDNRAYQDKVLQLDTYAYCSMCVQSELENCQALLDIGNGGFFNYDVSQIERVVILDLCINPDLTYGENVKPIQGDATNFDLDQKFDVIVLQMLLHHITGRSPQASLRNIEKVLHCCAEHLTPQGKIILIESVVPHWFYFIEKIAFRLLHRIWSFDHPITLQHPAEEFLKMAKHLGLRLDEYTLIPKGKWLLQFGLLFPSALTPVQPIKLVLSRPR